MKTKNVHFMTQAAVIAAIYVILTFLANTLGLASGVIQVRLSEMLTVLPYFTTAAIPGVTIGCLISNILTGCSLLDIVFGTLATLLGALGSYWLRKHKFLVPIPPIVANIIIVPWVLRISYGVPDAIPYMMLTVGIGEIISCGVLGTILLIALNKYKHIIFHTSLNQN